MSLTCPVFSNLADLNLLKWLVPSAPAYTIWKVCGPFRNNWIGNYEIMEVEIMKIDELEGNWLCVIS
jgi:hypothetical protein